MAAGTETGLAVQEVAYAGLDALRGAVDLDLCAYLHAVPGLGPQLYLRAPDLSTMDAAQAFDLFSALRDALTDTTPGVRDLRVTTFHAVAVHTTGPTSQGLFVAGRRNEPLHTVARNLVASLCQAIGVACHAVEDAVRPAPAGPSDRQPVRVAAEVDDSVARAEVVVRAGGETLEGRAEGSTTTTAVAEATLTAIGADLKIGDVTDGEVAGERVVIALVHDGEGRSAVAAALGGTDPMTATVVAVLDAAARLGR